MGKRSSKLEREELQFRKALIDDDKETVLKYLSDKSPIADCRFTDKGLTCMQMALLWGYADEVTSLLKSGRVDDHA